MKRSVILYAIILMGIYGVLSLLDLNSDYVVERKLWHINRKFLDVAKDPKAVPPQTFEALANEYKRIIRQHSKSRAIAGVYVVLGRIYIMKGDLSQARDVLGEITKLYPDYRELSAEAISLIAKTYELENNWAKARELYQKIIQEYPRTETGLSTPLYMANYYQTQNDFRSTMKAYAQAIDFYQKLITEQEHSTVEFNSLRYLANCYVAQNRWMEAIETLKQILIDYPEPQYLTVQRAELIIKTINAIVVNQLKNSDIAADIYKEFMVKYPQHPLNKTLKVVLDRLKENKNPDSQEVSVQ